MGHLVWWGSNIGSADFLDARVYATSRRDKQVPVNDCRASVCC